MRTASRAVHWHCLPLEERTSCDYASQPVILWEWRMCTAGSPLPTTQTWHTLQKKKKHYNNCHFVRTGRYRSGWDMTHCRAGRTGPHLIPQIENNTVMSLYRIMVLSVNFVISRYFFYFSTIIDMLWTLEDQNKSTALITVYNSTLQTKYCRSKLGSPRRCKTLQGTLQARDIF